MHAQKNKDSVQTNINFIDFKGLTVNAMVDKALFFQAETFNNDCSSVHKFSMDLYNLINKPLYLHAISYLLISVIGGLIFFVLGHKFANLI